MSDDYINSRRMSDHSGNCEEIKEQIVGADCVGVSLTRPTKFVAQMHALLVH